MDKIAKYERLKYMNSADKMPNKKKEKAKSKERQYNKKLCFIHKWNKE